MSQRITAFYDRYKTRPLAYEIGAMAVVLTLSIGQFYSRFHVDQPSEFHGFTTQNIGHVTAH